jgi:hypothetical protein
VIGVGRLAHGVAALQGRAERAAQRRDRGGQPGQPDLVGHAGRVSQDQAEQIARHQHQRRGEHDSEQGQVQRGHAEAGRGRGDDVEQGDLLARGRVRAALPQSGGDHDRHGGAGHRAKSDDGQPQRPEIVRQPPDVAGHQREHPGREGYGQRPHEPQRQPPRTVGPQHAQEQPDVAGDDPRDEAHAMLAALGAGAQFAHPASHGLRQRSGVRGRRQVAEHVPDQADDRLGGPLAHRHRAERGHGQDRDPVGRADVRDHRPPRGLQRQVGHAHRQVPAAFEEHPAPSRDQRAEVGRWLDQPVGDELHPPPNSGQLPGEPVGDLPGQAFGQLRRGSRRGQQADDQFRLP